MNMWMSDGESPGEGLWEAAAVEHECPRCEAPVGMPCTDHLIMLGRLVITDRPANHEARYRLVVGLDLADGPPMGDTPWP